MFLSPSPKSPVLKEWLSERQRGGGHLLLSNAKLFSHCMLLIILKSDFRKFDANTKVAIAAGVVLYFFVAVVHDVSVS